MKKAISAAVAFALISAIFAGCGEAPKESENSSPENESKTEIVEPAVQPEIEDAVNIVLSDGEITVDGTALGETPVNGVALGGEIVYYHDMDAYESGNPYGEGTEKDKHTEAEASAHTLVTITEPGAYAVTGKLSKGQLAVDLGEEAKADPNAKVTLFLNGADITCEIAPAVIFYNVYECGDKTLDTEGVADTSSAGANVIIVDGTENNINGSCVAKIYKDNAESKKLAKYDGAFYSLTSMNISADGEGTGILNVTAENEGIDSELHLTIHGGNINIKSQHDGINTNEDGISVTTVNGGNITISAGLGDEGDGIDSNGYLVINGGTIVSAAKSESGDGGIDADKGIIINGGIVIAFGGRNDDVDTSSKQNYMQFTFSETCKAGSKITLKDEDESVLAEAVSDRSFKSLTISSPELELNKEYTFFVNDVQQGYTVGAGQQGGMFPNRGGEEMRKNELTPPEGFDEWLEKAEDIPDEIRAWLESVAEKAGEFGAMGNKAPDAPADGQPEVPEKTGEQGAPDGGQGGLTSIVLNEFSTEFVITETNKTFSNVEAAEKTA